MQLLQPAAARNYKQLSILSAIGAIWLLCNFYTALHVLPAMQGTGPLLQRPGTADYSHYPLKVQELVFFYAFTNTPTPVFVIYSRIALRFCFWTLAAIILWKISSRFTRIYDACRLLGTLALGLLAIDEAVRLQVRGEAYRQSYFATYFSTWDRISALLIIAVIALLLLTPWYQLLRNRRRPRLTS